MKKYLLALLSICCFNIYATAQDLSCSEFIDELIELSSEEMPDDLGDGLTLTKMYKSGSSLCIDATIDESSITISQLQLLKDSGENLATAILSGIDGEEDGEYISIRGCLKEEGLSFKFTVRSIQSGKSVSYIATY